MDKSLNEMKLAELESLFIKLTDEFIAALDEGIDYKQLQEKRELIKELGQILDSKKQGKILQQSTKDL